MSTYCFVHTKNLKIYEDYNKNNFILSLALFSIKSYDLFLLFLIARVTINFSYLLNMFSNICSRVTCLGFN